MEQRIHKFTISRDEIFFKNEIFCDIIEQIAKRRADMEVYITAIKDILVVVAPIIVAFLSYKSSKKLNETFVWKLRRV